MVWAFGETKNAGPVTWVHENYRCPNCEIEFEDACCKNIPQGNFCVPDADTFEEDTQVDSKYGPAGCERFRGLLGIDEQALPCEIGLYYDFNVTDDGYPLGCTGLKDGPQNSWMGYHKLMELGLEEADIGRSNLLCDSNGNIHLLIYFIIIF